MNLSMLNFPVLFAIATLLVLWFAARWGTFLRTRHPLVTEERDDFGMVQTATLTLLALLIGFTFSMATVRYDLRKTYEEAEANAIGTEFVRAGLLPPSAGAQVQAQLRRYSHLRVLFYRTRSQKELDQINAETAQLQDAMWAAVQAPALAQPTPVMALAVSGMNDVLNSQGYTQAAWWNRIPVAAWVFLLATAIFCNILVGYGARSAKSKSRMVWVLPVLISISFLLIADIDSPRGGLIHVSPQNLVALDHSMGN